jgi:hypothetical protein
MKKVFCLCISLICFISCKNDEAILGGDCKPMFENGKIELDFHAHAGSAEIINTQYFWIDQLEEKIDDGEWIYHTPPQLSEIPLPKHSFQGEWYSIEGPRTTGDGKRVYEGEVLKYTVAENPNAFPRTVTVIFCRGACYGTFVIKQEGKK